MYLYEIAAIFSLSPQTFRKVLKSHSNPKIRELGSKKGTGSYFYTETEIKLILSEVKTK